MRIAIFDLQFMNYVYHSTPSPSAIAMLASGYHKSKGDEVVLVDAPPQFEAYDRVYINKDELDLFHDPSWLLHPNVVPIGRYWDGLEEYNREWETAPADILLYRGWVERWLDRYKKYNPDRLKHFYFKPHKLFRNGKFYPPKEEGLLILDDDLTEHEEIWDIIQEHPKQHYLYPFILKQGQKIDFKKAFEVLGFSNFFVGKRTLEFRGIPHEEELKEILKAYDEFRPTRLLILKLILIEHNDEDWIKTLEKTISFLARFRKVGRRVSVYPISLHEFKYPRVLQELKRWTGFNTAYNNNTCLDYILIDACRSLDRTFDFLNDPFKYLEEGRQGTNKLKEIVEIIQKDPQIIHIISEPCFGSTK